MKELDTDLPNLDPTSHGIAGEKTANTNNATQITQAEDKEAPAFLLKLYCSCASNSHVVQHVIVVIRYIAPVTSTLFYNYHQTQICGIKWTNNLMQMTQLCVVKMSDKQLMDGIFCI